MHHLLPGQPAPHFAGKALVNGEIKEISLCDFKGKYVVLVFYPLNFSLVCPTEVRAFNDEMDKFSSRDAVVITCSVDSVYAHERWTKMDRKEGGLGHMKIPMLSDITHAISRAYGVLDEKQGFAYRGTFLIDPDGIIRQITINDIPIGRSVEECMRLLDAVIYHKKHGNICPANWKSDNNK
ncbi:unnamed protein product [Dicrocoelium dendriticum]|nr:unnamed protein product [Dicrocoelium dendriticum]